MSRDDEVGDLVHFGERFLGLGDVPAIGEDLTGEEMAGGGDGVSGDDGGAGGNGAGCIRQDFSPGAIGCVCARAL